MKALTVAVCVLAAAALVAMGGVAGYLLADREAEPVTTTEVSTTTSTVTAADDEPGGAYEEVFGE